MLSPRTVRIGSLTLLALASALVVGRELQAQSVYELPAGKVGVAYAVPLQVKGGIPPHTWTLLGGQLPKGLSLSAAGELAGTPSDPRAEAFEFKVQVEDSSSPVKRLSLRLRLLIGAAELEFVPPEGASIAALEFVPPEAAEPKRDQSEGELRGEAKLWEREGGAGDAQRTQDKNKSSKVPPLPVNAQEKSPEAHAGETGTTQSLSKPILATTIIEGVRTLKGSGTPGARVRVFVNGLKVSVDQDTERVDDQGEFSVRLWEAVKQGQRLYVKQVAGEGDREAESPASAALTVEPSVYDWGRVRAYFSSGVVFSKERDEFSEQDIFVGVNVDANWFMHEVFKDKDKDKVKKEPKFYMYGNSYIDVRLTSIGLSGMGSGDTGGGTGGGTAGVETFLASRKAASMTGGVYLPFYRRSWSYRGDENALFIAPLGKFGFQSVVGGEPTREAIEFGQDDLFHFYGYGARFGHFKLSPSESVAPELISYIDIAMGQWENFEVVQEGGEKSRRTRYAIEGRLKIPGAPIQIGLDVNTGLGADDLRFFLGTNFDIGTLFGKLKSLEREQEPKR